MKNWGRVQIKISMSVLDQLYESDSKLVGHLEIIEHTRSHLNDEILSSVTYNRGEQLVLREYLKL